MVNYVDSSAEIEAKQLAGFFEGWPNPPTAETHLRILRSSTHVALAIENDGQVVGFATAISDGVLSAYISLLEVRSSHRSQGIGTQLIRELLRQLGGIYSISLHCDSELQEFYESLGMQRLAGMALRNFSAQAGEHAA